MKEQEKKETQAEREARQRLNQRMYDWFYTR
jgi:hypothetical protein